MFEFKGVIFYPRDEIKFVYIFWICLIKFMEKLVPVGNRKLLK